jgi:hypothetical protein
MACDKRVPRYRGVSQREELGTHDIPRRAAPSNARVVRQMLEDWPAAAVGHRPHAPAFIEPVIFCECNADGQDA